MDESRRSLELYSGIILFFSRTAFTQGYIFSSSATFSLIFFFFFWNIVLQLILFALYSSHIAFLTLSCLRFVHDLLVNLAGLILFSVPVISFINITEAIKYWDRVSLLILKKEEGQNAFYRFSAWPSFVLFYLTLLGMGIVGSIFSCSSVSNFYL